MNKKSILNVIWASILWGTSAIFVRLLSPFGFTSYQMTAVRAVISLVFISVFLLIKNRRIFKIKLNQVPWLLAIGALMFFTASLYYMSIQTTSAPTAVVLMYTSPIYVTVFSVLFLGERLTKTKGVAVGLMLIGCALVAGLIGGFKFDPLGILFGVLSGITYAAQNILSKILMNKKILPSSITLYTFMFMALVSLVTLEPVNFVSNMSKNPSVTIPLLLGLGLFTYAIPYILYNNALRDIPAGTASALCVIEPMAATLYSVLLFKERLDIFTLLGLVMIISAVIMLSRSEPVGDKAEEKSEDNNSD